MAPTYPVRGSKKTIAKKLLRCQKFERRNTAVMEILAGKTGAGGNLVVAHDFFREGNKYYKVTDKIDVASLGLEEIAKLS